MLRGELATAYAGHPEQLQEAIEELDDSLTAPPSLTDPDREAKIRAAIAAVG